MSDIESKYGTLNTIGKIISFIGWVIFGLSIFYFILFTGNIPDDAGLAVIPVAFGSVLGVVFGLLVVAQGQVITCFVSIEENTRETVELLRESEVENNSIEG